MLNIIDKDDKIPKLHTILGPATTGLNPLENVEMQKQTDQRYVLVRPSSSSYITISKPSWKGKQQMRLKIMHSRSTMISSFWAIKTYAHAHWARITFIPTSQGPASYGLEKKETTTCLELDKIYTMLNIMNHDIFFMLHTLCIFMWFNIFEYHNVVL